MKSSKQLSDRTLKLVRRNEKLVRKHVEKSITQKAKDTRHLLKNVQFSTISSMKPVSTPGAPPKKKRLNQSVSPGTTDGIIHKVCSSCDFYEILGVRTDATEKEIKKSYKKLALILHPDKSQSPLAADAFKHIRIRIYTTHNKITLDQNAYIQTILHKFNMADFEAEML
ncbi:hypothetical protein HHI36_019704 [Cryptolaemus montrouzieri]|uniref:J domain-containing protein n=1 Tax=Cryptolaemus montrouzieri TaxID=559131 RepID=A0ABD2N990_9CUCU